MADLIQLRRDTYDNWNLYNPVLAEGEVGIITHASGSGSSTPLNPLQCVVGDGSSSFQSLPKQAWAEPGLSGSMAASIAEVSSSLALASGSLESVKANIGYYTCTTLSGTAAKVVLSAPNYTAISGGAFKIKFTNKNTATSEVTLKVGNANAAPLYYDGVPVTNTNTWEAEETVDVYFDGNIYFANNVAGGGTFATGEKVKNVGIDSEPTAESTNLVESGGVYETITDVSGSVAADILELQQSVFPLTVTFTNNAANPSEYTGTAITPTLTWTSTRSGSPITPTEVKIKQGSTVLDTQTPATNTGTYVTSVNSIGATTFTAEVAAAGMVKSVNTTVSQVLPCYVGFYTPGATVNTMKGSLTKKVISNVTGIGGTYSNDNATKYLTICIPDTMTIHHIKSSGFDVPMQAVVTDTSMEVGGTTRTYNVYRSASPFNVTSVTIVVD